MFTALGFDSPLDSCALGQDWSLNVRTGIFLDSRNLHSPWSCMGHVLSHVGVHKAYTLQFQRCSPQVAGSLIYCAVKCTSLVFLSMLLYT